MADDEKVVIDATGDNIRGFGTVNYEDAVDSFGGGVKSADSPIADMAATEWLSRWSGRDRITVVSEAGDGLRVFSVSETLVPAETDVSTWQYRMDSQSMTGVIFDSETGLDLLRIDHTQFATAFPSAEVDVTNDIDEELDGLIDDVVAAAQPEQSVDETAIAAEVDADDDDDDDDDTPSSLREALNEFKLEMAEMGLRRKREQALAVAAANYHGTGSRSWELVAQAEDLMNWLDGECTSEDLFHKAD